MRCAAQLWGSEASLTRVRHGLQRSRVCSAALRYASCCTAPGTRSMDDWNGVTTEITPMTEEAVTIPSAGLKLSGVVHVPRALRPSERRGAFLVLHGFGSNKTSSNTRKPTKARTELGHVVLRVDIRGC